MPALFSEDLLLGLPAVLVYGQVGKGDVRTVLGEAEGNGFADTAGRTRYHGHFSFKQFHSQYI